MNHILSASNKLCNPHSVVVMFSMGWMAAPLGSLTPSTWPSTLWQHIQRPHIDVNDEELLIYMQVTYVLWSCEWVLMLYGLAVRDCDIISAPSNVMFWMISWASFTKTGSYFHDCNPAMGLFLLQLSVFHSTMQWIK